MKKAKISRKEKALVGTDHFIKGFLEFGLVMMTLGCTDKGTSVQDPASQSSSSLEVSSSPTLSSSSLPSSSSSAIAISSMGESSSSNLQSSSSLITQPVSSSLVPPSSSSQALVFSGGEVRIPDGCGIIHWLPHDEQTCVQNFWVDTTEVTIAAYQDLMGGGVPSLFHNGYYKWPNSSGGGYADDGSLCPDCPADGLTLFEAMLFANAMTKRYGNPSDTVYAYSAIDSTNSTGSYQKIKPREVVGLQNLQIATDKTGYRLPTRGEFHYIYYKGVLMDFPWDDLYPPTQDMWEAYDWHVWDTTNSGGVTQVVATKKPTAWHLYDLIGNADEWTTTPNADYPGEFLAVGGSVTVNGTGTQDLRFDEKHAGVRLIRGTSVVTFTPPSP